MDKIKEIRRLRKKAHAKLISLNSKTYKKFLEMEETAYSDGELSRKHKELIALAISVVLNCESCMQWHIEQAVKTGASKKELLEAMEIAIEFGGGPATVSIRFALEVMDQIYSMKKAD